MLSRPAGQRARQLNRQSVRPPGVEMRAHVKQVNWAWEDPSIQDILLKHYRFRLFGDANRAASEVESVLSFVPIVPPGDVLDIGCGLGFHAAEFATRGFRVLAYGPGNRYVELATQHVAEAEADVELRNMATSDLREKNRFNLAWGEAVCFGQRTPAQLFGDFSQVLEALMPGGWFVCTVAGWPKDAPSERTRNWGELEDCFVLTEKWRDEQFYHEHCWFVYPQDNQIIKIIEDERMYGFQEIAPLLKQAGFVDLEMFSDLSASSPAQIGEHFAFRCRRRA